MDTQSENERPLTEKEARMVESVLPLVSHCLRLRGMRLTDDQYDEYRSHAYITLCRVVKSYDPSRGAWTTLATTCINNRMNEWISMAKYNQTRHKVLCVWRHKQGVASKSEGRMAMNVLGTSSLESISDPIVDTAESVEDQAIAAYMRHKVQTAARRMTDRQREVLEGRLQGDALSVIADRMGLSRQFVHMVNARVLTIIRKELALEEEEE